ncbi:ParB/RepB/Spo0J family partition protein [Yoonia sp. 208BN28-4]|uniref:ParB/RepB/Spo0J family partition protein n=1 Tax=Yoonia sp. 208BN28-4 TaxID=3126505 RepID=UPI0030A190EC
MTAETANLTTIDGVAYRPVIITDADRIAHKKAEGSAARPEMMWIPIDQLVLDDDFQRPLARANWTAIRRIAAAFNWAHFTPVIVAPVADGMFAIIDGQHRTHAALMVSRSDVPCMVVDLTVPEQAAAFAAINGQVTAVSAFHIYKAALCAREAWAVTCDAVVRDAGCQLMTYHPSAATKKGGEVYCVGLIKTEVAAKRGAVVTLVLDALRRSQHGDNAAVYNYGVLRPLLTVVAGAPRAQRRDLAAFFDAHDPMGIVKRVHRMRLDPKYAQETQAVLMARAVSALLNQWLGDVA